MAGFIENTNRQIGNQLSKLSRFNPRYEDLLLKNSQAIGFIESQLMAKTKHSMSRGDDLLRYSMAISDTTSQLRSKSIAFFKMDYVVKRERLRDVASNGEIEFIIETITDDMVVYNDDNMFCFPGDLTGRIMYKGSSKEERLRYQEDIREKYRDNFEKIYNAWGFGEGIAAWQYAYQFLIEGYLAFEIIYDNPKKPKEIIGFKELDPASLQPGMARDAKGKLMLQWTQYDANTGSTRALTDSQIIYISYANHFRTKRVSFVERLIRSFNLLRLIEHSKVIWHVMNAPIRLTTTVPVGSKSIQKAQEDVREFMNILKEDIFFDGSSGELTVEGKPNVLFYKNYVLPVNDKNEQVKIEPLSYPGPNLSGSELLNHFLKKLKMDSKIPYSRWEGQSGMGAFTLNAEGISREEVRYNKFIKRLRSAFKELMTKPLYLQMCIDKPSLKDDHKFRNAIGLMWHNDNVFEEMKQKELDAKRTASFLAKKGIMNDDGTSFFSTEYLVRKELKLTEEEIAANASYKAIEEGDQEADSKAAEGAAGDLISASAPDIGGGSAPPPPTPEAPTGGGAETTEGGETEGEGAL